MDEQVTIRIVAGQTTMLVYNGGNSDEFVEFVEIAPVESVILLMSGSNHA
jgi:hypothetical protein